MVKVRVVSDLHLEFHKYSENADTYHPTDVNHYKIIPPMDDDSQKVLVLAGDIIKGIDVEAFLPLFKALSERFKAVLWVWGNHEYYDGVIGETMPNAVVILSNFKNVFILENESITIEDKIFYGGTMWTNFDNENPLSMVYAQRGMSDYHCITKSDFSQFNPMDSLYIHKEFIANLKSLISNNPNKEVFVISHHAPTKQAISPKFATSLLNPAFVSDLEYIMDYEENIRFWVFGHVHQCHRIIINHTKLIANPRGYGYFDIDVTKENPEYNPYLTLDF